MKEKIQERIKELRSELEALKITKKQLAKHAKSLPHKTYERTEAKHEYIECLDQIHTIETVIREFENIID